MLKQQKDRVTLTGTSPFARVDHDTTACHTHQVLKLLQVFWVIIIIDQHAQHCMQAIW
jgi:hypothetical protein